MVSLEEFIKLELKGCSRDVQFFYGPVNLFGQEPDYFQTQSVWLVETDAWRQTYSIILDYQAAGSAVVRG